MSARTQLTYLTDQVKETPFSDKDCLLCHSEVNKASKEVLGFQVCSECYLNLSKSTKN